MKREDWLKEKLKDRFEGFDPQLDLDKAWMDLEKRRNPKKNNRRFIFWFLGFGFVLLAIGAFWNLNSNNSIDKDPLAVQEIQLEEAGIRNAIESENEEYVKIKESVLENNSLPEQKKEESKPVQQTQIIQSIQTSNTYNYVSTQKRIEADPIISDLIQIHETKESKTQQTSTAKTKSTEGQGIKNELKKTNITMDLLPSITIRALDNIIVNYNPDLVEPTLPVKKASKYMLGLSFAYGKHARELSDINTDRLLINSSRNRQESALDAVGINLFLRRQLFKKQFVEFGTGFMQTSYLFEDEKTREEQTELDRVLTERHTYPDGSEKLVYGTGIETSNITRQSKFYQNYRQFDIYALLGHEILIGTSFGCIISAGMEYSLMNKASGVSFVEEEDFLEYGKLEDLEYRTAGIFSGLINFGLSKELGKGFRSELTLSAKRNITNLGAGDTFSDKRSHLLGRISFLKTM